MILTQTQFRPYGRFLRWNPNNRVPLPKRPAPAPASNPILDALRQSNELSAAAARAQREAQELDAKKRGKSTPGGQTKLTGRGRRNSDDWFELHSQREEYSENPDEE